jgi:DNA-binding MarR family transcriptional regulator
MSRQRSQPTAAAPLPGAKNRAAASDEPMTRSALEHISFAIGRSYYGHLGMLERVLTEIGLDEHVRPGMGYILFALFERDDQAIKEIVELAEVSHSTLSGMLRRMKRGGLIELCRDAADGRSVRVRLTPLGKSLEPRCQRALRRVNEIMTTDVSDRELRIAERTLKKMTKAMRIYERERRLKSKGRS